ncbi:hypothetical protein BLNAU_2777 [Blattamonas nauphoetae]|uniref:Calcineurin-like phosphoesterase domain-containing protein n=1 Tax=Blattamonas nauphoetae TaxID=2049346 RepID=A0ABQ9YEC6_9EUKA|nr:hypothetical protein BLNAU_2777 [Blattamonas nauphoetae]
MFQPLQPLPHLPPPFPPNPTHLEILIVSDIHGTNENLEKVRVWANRTHSRFDLALCLGDLANIKYDSPLPNVDELVEEESRTLQAIHDLQNLAHTVIFVPGNHDVPQTYNPFSGFLPEHTINLHNQAVQICDGLVMCGLGGCVPGFSEGSKKFIGYPFESDQELATFFTTSTLRRLALEFNFPEGFISEEAFFEQQKRHKKQINSMMSLDDEEESPQETKGPLVAPSNIPPSYNLPLLSNAQEMKLSINPSSQVITSPELPFRKDQVIFLSHTGPSGFPSTVTNFPDRSAVFYGSQAITDFFADPEITNFKDNTLAFIHGHTHDSMGIFPTHKRFPPIMNVGALYKGSFGILSLFKDNGKWTIEKSSLGSFPR